MNDVANELIAPPVVDWDAEGQRVGSTLVSVHAVVVAGADVVAVARVALGIGRAQAEHRRVVVVDLLGDPSPLGDLFDQADAPGIVDCLEYGVSFARVARAVPEVDQLFAVPVGTEAPDFAVVCPHPRWRRLVSAFRDAGELLVVAIPADVERLDDLAAATDGALVVGADTPPRLSASFIIGLVRPPRESPAAPPADDQVPAPAVEQVAGRGRGVGVFLVTLLAVVVFWLANRPLAHSTKPSPAGLMSPQGVATGGSQPVELTAADSAAAARDPAMDSLLGVPQITNPEDAPQAARYAVELMAASTYAGAMLKLQKDGRNLPAGTFSPVLIGEAQWFKVYAGAFAVRDSADSLLARLGHDGFLKAGASVVTVPFTFRIDIVDRPSAVGPMLAEYFSRDRPVYALRQDDGTVWLCIGAFASPDAALPYAESLKASRIEHVLVYRKGRIF